MAAVDQNLRITFVLWNNHGYGEIATSMEGVGVEVIGCDPTPPDFAATAASFGVPYKRIRQDPIAVAAALTEAIAQNGPAILEIDIAGRRSDQE
jgi:acetolactate synthase-1/2/3 large subunit